MEALEKGLAVKLFARTSTGYVLTTEGERWLPAIQQVAGEVAHGLHASRVRPFKKNDKVARNEREKSLGDLRASIATVVKNVPIVATSAETGEGRDDVGRMIRRHSALSPKRRSHPRRDGRWRARLSYARR